MTALAILIFTAAAFAVAHVVFATIAPALPRMIDLLRKEL